MRRRLLVAAPLALLIVALPAAGTAGLLRACLVYGVAAWVPGFVIWRALGRRDTGPLDLVLVPSLIGLVPFAWLAFAGIASGLDARHAGWLALTPFVALAVLRDGLRVERREAVPVVAAFAASALLLVVPFAANGFAAAAWDGPLHAAITSRVVAGHVPPDSPWVAGQGINYYWLYHVHAATIARITGLGSYQAFALINVHFLAVLFLAGYRLTARLAAGATGRLLGATLLVFGINPFGWILFLGGAGREAAGWYSLVVPEEMVRGYPVALASMIHEFLDGNPFPIAFPFMVFWLDQAAGRLGGERGREWFGTGLLALLGALMIHLFTAVFFLAAAGFATALSCLTAARRREAWGRARGLLALVLLGGLLAAYYAWTVLAPKRGLPVQLDLTPDFVGRQLLALAATLGLLAILALPAVLAAWKPASGGPAFVAGYVLPLLAGASVLRMAGDTQYKLHYLACLGLAPLAGAAWSFWGRARPLRVLCLGAVLVTLPTNAITSLAFTRQPPREVMNTTQVALLGWIRESTPADSVFVEAEYWAPYRRSSADWLYLDRRWFDIPIYTGRRRFAGYVDEVLVDQWGHRDIPRRRRIAGGLLAGRPLTDEDRSYLRELDAPLYVVVHGPPAAPPAFDPRTFRLVFERPELRVYRVEVG